MAHHDKIIEGRIDELIELIDNSRYRDSAARIGELLTLTK